MGNFSAFPKDGVLPPGQYQRVTCTIAATSPSESHFKLSNNPGSPSISNSGTTVGASGRLRAPQGRFSEGVDKTLTPSVSLARFRPFFVSRSMGWPLLCTSGFLKIRTADTHWEQVVDPRAISET